MEPQINYGSMGMPQEPGQQKVYGKSKLKGCFIISLILILVILAAASYFIYKGVSGVKDLYDVKLKNDPSNQKKSITGDNSDSRFEGTFADAVVIQQKGNSPKIWILTNASKTIIKTIKRAGYYSTGAACIDCKTKAYIFDPSEDKILQQTENKFQDLVTESNIFEVNGKVIQFTRDYGDNPPTINIYDASSGAIISDTQDFIAQHDELKSGIIHLNYSRFYGTITFDTKDGQKNLIYCPQKDKIYVDNSKMDEDLASDAGDGQGIICELKSGTHDKRYNLWKVTASKKDLILRKSSFLSYIGEPSHIKLVSKDAETETVSDKIYLQGIIYYQDDNIAVIIYVDQAGKTADRIMTCIDLSSGKDLWTVNQDRLFSFMKIDETKNTYNGFDATKDKISVRKDGNLVTLSFLGGGIMGFDSETGKKLWALEIHN